MNQKKICGIEHIPSHFTIVQLKEYQRMMYTEDQFKREIGDRVSKKYIGLSPLRVEIKEESADWKL